MGREVRRVPKDWVHPKEKRFDYLGRQREAFIPLHPGEDYQVRVDDWDEECVKWKAGWRPDYCSEPEDTGMTYEQWAGQRPHRDNYMPNWPVEERTHYQMYETCSEGTPISPVMKDPYELARWLADNNASSFGSMTATYEQWLAMIGEGWAPSAVMGSEGLVSGVAAVSKE